MSTRLRLKWKRGKGATAEFFTAKCGAATVQIIHGTFAPACDFIVEPVWNVTDERRTLKAKSERDAKAEAERLLAARLREMLKELEGE